MWIQKILVTLSRQLWQVRQVHRFEANSQARGKDQGSYQKGRRKNYEEQEIRHLPRRQEGRQQKETL